MGHRRETLPGTQSRLILGTRWRRDCGGRLRGNINHVMFLFASLFRRLGLHLRGPKKDQNGIAVLVDEAETCPSFGGLDEDICLVLAEGESGSRSGVRDEVGVRSTLLCYF